MAKVGTWCFLRDSTKLKAAIRYQINKRNLLIKDLGKISGVAPDKISKYLTGSYARSLTQFQLVSVARALGIEIDITISYTDRD
jgi:hypothetical protein